MIAMVNSIFDHGSLGGSVHGFFTANLVSAAPPTIGLTVFSLRTFFFTAKMTFLTCLPYVQAAIHPAHPRATNDVPQR